MTIPLLHVPFSSANMKELFEIHNFSDPGVRRSDEKSYSYYTLYVSVRNWRGEKRSCRLVVRLTKENQMCCDLRATISVLNQSTRLPVCTRVMMEKCMSGSVHVIETSFDNAIFETDGVQVDDAIIVEIDFSMTITTPVYGNPAASFDKITQSTITSYFFMRENVSDVKFLVGPDEKEVSANKTILSLRSPVFERMFFGSLPSEDVVKLPDVAYESFISLLRYVYRLEAVIDKNLIVETLYMADKYEIPDLKQAIGILLKPESIYKVLGYETETESLPTCSDHLQRYIRKSAEFLDSPHFLLMSPASVQFVVGIDEWKVNELKLWNRCVEWAKAESQRKPAAGCKRKPKKVRRVMLPFLHDFRFPRMSAADFTEGPLASGILNVKEIQDYFQFIHLGVEPKIFPKER